MATLCKMTDIFLKPIHLLAKIKLNLVTQVQNSITNLTLGVITFMTSKCGKQTSSAAIISMCQKSIRHAVNFYQKLRSCMAIMKFEKNHQILKGGLISESFSLWIKYPQKLSKTTHLPSKDSVLVSFLGIWTKVKNFLRSSHLYRYIVQLFKKMLTSFSKSSRKIILST